MLTDLDKSKKFPHSHIDQLHRLMDWWGGYTDRRGHPSGGEFNAVQLFFLIGKPGWQEMLQIPENRGMGRIRPRNTYFHKEDWKGNQCFLPLWMQRAVYGSNVLCRPFCLCFNFIASAPATCLSSAMDPILYIPSKSKLFSPPSASLPSRLWLPLLLLPSGRSEWRAFHLSKAAVRLKHHRGRVGWNHTRLVSSKYKGRGGE